MGETVGDGVVSAVEAHAEYERISVRLPDGRELQVEASLADGAPGGACEAHGLVLQPRWELLGQDVQVEDQPAAVRALCERLAERGAELSLLPRPVQVESAEDEDEPVLVLPRGRAWRPSWLHAVLGGLGVCLVVGLWRPAREVSARSWWELFGVSLAGLLPRLLLSPRALFLGPDAGFERLVLAWGMFGDHPLYGGGYGALMGVGQALSGWRPEAVFATNLVLALLAPPLVWALLRAWPMRVPPGGPVALLGGLIMALLPVHLRLSATELMPVSLLTMELLAVASALGAVRYRSAALALAGGLAAGFAAHIRPEALPFVVVPAAAIALTSAPGVGGLGRALWAGLPALGLALLRLWALGFGPSSGAARPEGLLQIQTWTRVITPVFAASPVDHDLFVFSDLGVTPVALPVLALLGLWGMRWRGRGVLLGWWGLTALPVLAKAWPLADAMRLQLAQQAPLVVMAALGAGVAWGWRRWMPALVGAALVAQSLPYLGWVSQRWATQVEWQIIQRCAADLPPGATMWYDDATEHGANIGQVLANLAPDRSPRLRGMGAALDGGELGSDGGERLAFVGVSCRARRSGRVGSVACDGLLTRCRLSPWCVGTVPGQTDADIVLPPEGAQVGWYRVETCSGSADTQPSPESAIPPR